MRHSSFRRALVFALASGMSLAVLTAQQPPAPRTADAPFRGIALRSLGPSMATGRVADFAIDPRNPAVWYVGIASGNVWKSVNHGLDWTPIFDNQGSYSIGVVEIVEASPRASP